MHIDICVHLKFIFTFNILVSTGCQLSIIIIIQSIKWITAVLGHVLDFPKVASLEHLQLS